MAYLTAPGGDTTAAAARSLQYYSPQFRRELNGPVSGMGNMYRFNRAVARGIYTLPFHRSTVQGLGQTEVDPTMLFTGIGLLGLGLFLLGRKKGRSSRRRRRG